MQNWISKKKQTNKQKQKQKNRQNKKQKTNKQTNKKEKKRKERKKKEKKKHKKTSFQKFWVGWKRENKHLFWGPNPGSNHFVDTVCTTLPFFFFFFFDWHGA